MIDAHTVQFRLNFDFELFIYNSLNFYEFLKKSFSIDVNGDVAQQLSKRSCKLFKMCVYIEFNEDIQNISIMI